MTVSAIYGTMIVAFTAGLIKGKARSRSASVQAGGFVSVIIPVRNEASNIRRLLQEICDQEFHAGSFEVIVSDDHSEDDTMTIARSFADLHPGFSLKLVLAAPGETGRPGKKSAILRAIDLAEGDILLLTDADTGRGRGWISAMNAAFALPGTRMVLGPVYYDQERNILQTIGSLEFLGLMGTTAGSAALGFPVMCNGANLAYRRNAFMQAGGFSGNLHYISGDDQFIMSAIRKHFGKRSVVFNDDPAAVVSTVAEATLTGFIQQRLRWVSKSRGYRDPVVLAAGAVTYLTHALLLAGMLWGCFYPKLFFLSFCLWLVKILLEYPLVWIMARFFGKSRLSGYYFIAQVFQLVYVPVAGLLGMFLPFRWKGRKG